MISRSINLLANGLANNDLDLIPQFDRYISAFQGFDALVFGVFNQGVNLMLTSNDIVNIRGQLDIQKNPSKVTSLTQSRCYAMLRKHSKMQKNQKRPDGSIAVQLLQRSIDTQQAKTNRLELAGVNFASAPPSTAPQSLSFWGRGVGLVYPTKRIRSEPARFNCIK